MKVLVERLVELSATLGTSVGDSSASLVSEGNNRIDPGTRAAELVSAHRQGLGRISTVTMFIRHRQPPNSHEIKAPR
jgi:hypothetical protein